jgi:hypothetical protein
MSDPTKGTFGNRGTGRTTVIIQAAKEAAERGVRVLVVGHTHDQAKRIADQVGPRTECVGSDSVSLRLRGSDFVPFVDHHAVEMWAAKIEDMETSIARAKAATTRAQEATEQLRGELAEAKLATIRTHERWYAAAEEAERWRARCPVTVGDVEVSGVSADQCEAFLLANGGHRVGHGRFNVFSPGESEWAQWMGGSTASCITEACNDFADWSSKPAQDVLAEMLATEVKG